MKILWIFLLILGNGWGAGPKDWSYSFLEAQYQKSLDQSSLIGASFSLQLLACFVKSAEWVSIPFPSKKITRDELKCIYDLTTFASRFSLNHFLWGPSGWTEITPGQFVRKDEKSWVENRQNLSQVPIKSVADAKLIQFLENRWLAKADGFFRMEVDHIAPCFGSIVSVHPQTTNSYARDPFTQKSLSYDAQVANIKKILPQSQEYPLILTRPCSLETCLPSYFSVNSKEDIHKAILNSQGKCILDFTEVLISKERSAEDWVTRWQRAKELLVGACETLGVDPDQLICIERPFQEELGAIRTLPFASSMNQHHQLLLERISNFGLTATQVELDRQAFPHHLVPRIGRVLLEPKEVLQNRLNGQWESGHSQKDLMIGATLKLIEALFSEISDESWREMEKGEARAAIVQLSCKNIEKGLKKLIEDPKSFFEIVAEIEEIHANILPLVEIFSPFKIADFRGIYKEIIDLPERESFSVSYGIHSSAMASLNGVIRSIEKKNKSVPQIIYGENTYFECKNLVDRLGDSANVHMSTAASASTAEQWRQADLIIAQFQPVWQINHHEVEEYQVERVAKNIRLAMCAGRVKPLVVALDTTIGDLSSSCVHGLLDEFQKEIEEGFLSIFCFRSGLKFDLLGMDNFAGAPFFFVHNQDAHWNFLQPLLSDEALQTDRLSLNWFCLSYRSIAPELKSYYRQIVQNTRDLLDKIPKRLFDSKMRYFVRPMGSDVEPIFVDLKVTGPFHQMKAALIVGGTLYLRPWEAGYPVFVRRSIGFSHSNFGIVFGEKSSTVRLTLGLDPEQVDVFVRCFEKIDSLN